MPQTPLPEGLELQSLLSPQQNSPAPSISKSNYDANISTISLLPTPKPQKTTSNPLITPKKKWYQKSEITLSPDAELHLAASFNSWFWPLLLREILPIAGIITAIILGATSRQFSFNPTSLLGIGIDVDLQLALVGFLNKILDTFVQASLKHTASLFLTSWMSFTPSKSTPQSTFPSQSPTQPPHQNRGITLLDFELEKELVQPWTCLQNFYTLTRTTPHLTLPQILRFLLCLTISICVLLLALSINTLGVPKERWYPNIPSSGWSLTSSTKNGLTITTPKMEINDINWGNYWSSGWDLVGNGASSWEASYSLLASSTYTLLSGLPPLYRDTKPGWLPVGNEIEGSITGVNTMIDKEDRRVETISVQNWRVRDIFDYLRENGTEEYYKVSFGWQGDVNITVPFLTTLCTEGLPEGSDIPIATMPIQTPTTTTISIPIGAIPLLNFTGATCTLTFQQALYPISTWIVKMSTIDVSLNSYGQKMNNTAIPFPTSPTDISITQSLATQIGITVGHMNGLMPSGLIYHMILMSRRLTEINSAFLPNAGDAAALTPIIAVLAQHLLTISVWNQTSSPTNENVTSYPIRWQVYGSGPRLPWEWATVTVVIVILLALLAGAIMKGMWRLRPGPWLEIGGMLCLANESHRMESVAGSCGGEVGEKGREGRFFVRDVGGEVRLVDIGEKGEGLRRETVYVGERVVMRGERGWDWGLLWRWCLGNKNS